MERYPEGARLEQGKGGLDRLALDAAAGEALVYVQGAHVAHFQPKGGRPVLWMSAASRFEAGKPLRGGVPVCFPWFGPKAGAPEAPMHGFARILPWTLAAVTRGTDGSLRAELELGPEEAARGGFATELVPSLAVVVSRSLRVELTVRNAGTAAATFEEALHSYFAVSDVRKVRIGGLEDVGCVDKTAGMVRRSPAGEPIVIAAETDRVYTGATGTVTVEDPGWRRRIVVAKHGSATTVVWNPGVAKAKAMPDFGDDEWTGMVCVETANALDDAIHLSPGDSHVMTATIDVEAGSAPGSGPSRRA
jgi:D-hexose-6-phosphate mutarotase